MRNFTIISFNNIECMNKLQVTMETHTIYVGVLVYKELEIEAK